MDELERAAKRLKSTIDHHQSSLSAEAQKLDDEEKRIRDRLSDIDERKQQCAAENGITDVSDDDLIEINAGGKIIAAKRGVLTQRKGTRYEALFSGRWEKKLQRDGSGRIFLDVNPKAFRAIVDWLNMMSISSEDDCPEPPTVDVENKGILKHHMQLFFAQLTNIDSKIIRSAKDVNIIHNWLNEDNSDGELHLLYRSSRDGLSAEEFHHTCDNKGRTFVLIETTEGVVGGYSNSDWDGEIGWRNANKAFLFILSGFDLTSPCKRKLKNADVTCAILGMEEYGPAFGGGCDLNVDGSEVAFFNGSTYEPFETPRLPLATVTTYPIKEMEVFQVSDIPNNYQDLKLFQQIPSILSTKSLPEVSRFTKEVNDAINERRTALEKLEEEVIFIEESFKDEEQFIDLFACGSVNDVVMLNVSGANMALKRDTLMVMEESMLAQQFDDAKWTEQGCDNVRVKEWTPDDVANWVKVIDDVPDDIATLFTDNEIKGSELLALDRDGLKDIGVKRVGTICLLLKEIKQLEKASQDVVTFIEQSPYCFGKLVDFLRLKHLSSLGLSVDPALPSVCEHKKDMFEKMIRYYFPGDGSKLILG
ncbi:hypothetical protein QTG54_014787 [Skeletonema marinoi]|uniref:SAM domain-containing protein n=1 Tax=Skeletonema marinoi TaxID=267567 RepID=A0AAD8XVV1_9STRA|nr:hypothetical protein QTG54_014787 [Skeletonema marinoi]